ncbi:hypothetical protein SZ64_00710 [Erythrobacter sp. SG61-1L]|uniref:hypothetical protein n=1 Tax=Erythrobacter sp. SG61-1L TaxID=1603897 RepID=UPI0006C8EC61|nr:hypothetical protein [Erythrobacter sp. SG61-1L]KPL66750.1 hypothetical protein SZ64_00710 [Erythrobacter sp. SG61-1L]
MKAATIYERGGKIYVHSSSKTTAGIWVINDPVMIVEKDDVEELGLSVRRCLDASREGVPHPKSFANLFDPVLALAGVKSFNTFVKSAKCVEVEMVGETATLIPTRNEGAEDGFVPLFGKAQAAVDTNKAVGSAAVAALAIAV